MQSQSGVRSVGGVNRSYRCPCTHPVGDTCYSDGQLFTVDVAAQIHHYRPQTKFAKVVFTGVCLSTGGACVVAPGGGHAWLLWGGVCGCSRGGMCGCSGGMHGCSGGGGHVWLLWGVCMVALGGHVWLLLGGVHGCSRGHAWLLGGMRGCSQGGVHVWFFR